MPDYHHHGADSQVPVIERIEALRVTFPRGTGCCEESPVRRVTAFYDALDGHFIAQVDPIDPPKGGHIVPPGMFTLTERIFAGGKAEPEEPS